MTWATLREILPPPQRVLGFMCWRGKCCAFFYWGFSSRQCVAKILFFLGSVFVIHFRERTFVFVVLMPPCVFQWCFAYVFAYLLGFLFPKMLGKNSLLLRFGFRDPFSGANFCFCCLDAALCFSVVFCLCFCIFVGLSVPENAWQKFAPS